MYSLVEYSNEPKQEFNFRAIPLRCAAKNSTYGKKVTSVRSWFKISKKCNLLTIGAIRFLTDKWVKVPDYSRAWLSPAKNHSYFIIRNSSSKRQSLGSWGLLQSSPQIPLPGQVLAVEMLLLCHGDEVVLMHGATISPSIAAQPCYFNDTDAKVSLCCCLDWQKKSLILS